MTIHIDLDVLSKEIGLSKVPLTELLYVYCNEMKSEIHQVNKLVGLKDWHKLQRTIHNIKGVSGNLCMHNMYTAAAEVDQKLKNNVFDGLEDSIQNMLEVYDCTSRNIFKALELSPPHSQE